MGERGENLKWSKPDIASDKNQDEVDRAADELGLDRDTIASGIEGGRLVPLDAQTWAQVEGTDSLEVKSLKDMRRRAKKRYASRAAKNKILQHLEEFVLDEVTAPILLRLDYGDRYYLLNGNTRLSIADLFAVTPQVWMADVSTSGAKAAEEPADA